MDRRSFLSRIGIGVAATSAAEAASQPAGLRDIQRVTWSIGGFTCVTCAVGLEVMVRGLKGVLTVNASYPKNNVEISFDKRQTSEGTVRQFISKCGFSVVTNGEHR